jgi:hypothetical protein
MAAAFQENCCDPQGAAKLHAMRVKQQTKRLSKVYVFIKPEDIPLAPGPAPTCQDEPEESFQTAEEADLLKIKTRIKKMLDLGLHPNTSEVESQQSMRLAQKLLTKFNLKQVDILNHAGENDHGSGGKSGANRAMRGGVVNVELRKRVDGEHNIDTPLPSTWPPQAQHARRAPFLSWLADLASPVCKNFDVKCYTSSGCYCNEIVFYGVYTNAQLAAYAFKV